MQRCKNNNLSISNDFINDFIINIDIVAKWIGSKKGTIKDTLKNTYKLNIDSKISKSNKEIILLTHDCFKHICLLWGWRNFNLKTSLHRQK